MIKNTKIARRMDQYFLSGSFHFPLHQSDVLQQILTCQNKDDNGGCNSD